MENRPYQILIQEENNLYRFYFKKFRNLDEALDCKNILIKDVVWKNCTFRIIKNVSEIYDSEIVTV